MSLTLVGTVHLDPEGEAGLRALLVERAPGVVTLEVSPYAAGFRRRRGRELLERLGRFRGPGGGPLPPALEPVAAQVALPFELRAAEAYADEVGARVVLLGDSGESRELLARLEEEVFAPENLERLAREEGAPPLGRRVAAERARAARDWERPPLLGTSAAARLGAREERLAAGIRAELVRLPDDEALVHVGGWEHLRGLARRLADLDPQVRLLG